MYLIAPDTEMSLLDLVFSSDPNSIDQITNLSGLESSDHDCLLWKYKCYGNPPVIKNNTPKYNYREGDYNTTNNYFETID